MIVDTRSPARVNTDSSDYAKAILNILEDLATEKARLEATQMAMVNILEDFDAERVNVERANVDLRVVNEAMKGFTAVAAHDLRSPLTAIMGFAGVLDDNWDELDEEDRRIYAATINRQANKLSSLVDDLLTVSVLEGGVLPVYPRHIVLADALERYRETDEFTTTTGVMVSCPADLVVWLDPRHLERMIDNYVQNALKYGEAPVCIEAALVGHLVEVRVYDQGAGVPAEFVQHLFGKFARANTALTKARMGTGLGLSIVRGLAEVNGGHARYEPNLPRGACFILGLPVVDGTSL
jgi:signal transduction histidine kinase